MAKKTLKQRQVEALEAIAKALEPSPLPLTDDRDKDEWGYPRRYSESGW